MSKVRFRSHRDWMLPIALTVVVLFAAGDSRAGEETGWRLRVDFGFFNPTGDGITIDTETTFSAELDSGAGIGVRSEYQWSRRLGVEFGFFSGASTNISVGSSGSASLEVSSFVPFAVGLDVHLTPASRVDLYIGPQVAWVNYSGIKAASGSGSSSASLSVDTSVGAAAILGLDVPVGSRKKWTFQVNLRYFDTSIEGSASSGRVEADFDPTVFSLGFGYRF